MPAVTASTLAATVSTPATVASTAAATASTPAAAASMPAVAASTPAVAASMPAATGIPAGALNVGTEVASRKGRAKKPKPALWPGTTVSGKHVCGHEWITNNPGGTKEQFEAFWKSLSKAAKNSFVAQAKALKSSTSSVPSVSQTGTIDSIQSVSQPGAASAVLSQPGAASAVPSQPGAASACRIGCAFGHYVNYVEIVSALRIAMWFNTPWLVMYTVGFQHPGGGGFHVQLWRM
ncbi:hypothetical protein A0H81_14610 [Grifola frondosa]|uniref:Uncharacterized protein n=1 Tax=Grifola frondosa TaxID=5627 RepID=A0A1C7LL63_GRIFR|nr:hypothetical protein A0H81_14610 [Grifola frondosa]